MLNMFACTRKEGTFMNLLENWEVGSLKCYGSPSDLIVFSLIPAHVLTHSDCDAVIRLLKKKIRNEWI